MRSFSDCLRPGRRLPVLALSLLGAMGCGEDAESPTGPQEPGTPALATGTAASPLVFRSVSAGDTHTCGVTTDNRAYCWGHNFVGQLGDGTRTDHYRPAPVVGGLRFRNVSVGPDHSCGVTTDDRAYCWGYAGFGKLGDGTNSTITPQPVPVAGGHRFHHVRAGINHTCAITPAPEAVAFCWGDNRVGQLGDFSHKQRLTPVLVGGGLHWRWVSPGEYHTCGVTTGNRGYCWGSNTQGQLGVAGAATAHRRSRSELGSHSGTSRRVAFIPVVSPRRAGRTAGGTTLTASSATAPEQRAPRRPQLLANASSRTSARPISIPAA